MVKLQNILISLLTVAIALGFNTEAAKVTVGLRNDKELSYESAYLESYM